MKLELHATPEEVMRGVEALREFARAQCLSEKTVFDLSLALEECGSNIVNHAYKRDPAQTFSVTFHRNGSAIYIELRDCGPPFDPTRVQCKPLADGEEPGGWGIQLVRYHTDELQYRREGEENVLRLTRQLTPTEDAI